MPTVNVGLFQRYSRAITDIERGARKKIQSLDFFMFVSWRAMSSKGSKNFFDGSIRISNEVTKSQERLDKMTTCSLSLGLGTNMDIEFVFL